MNKMRCCGRGSLLLAAFGAGLLFAMVCPPRLILILVAIALVLMGARIIACR